MTGRKRSADASVDQSGGVGGGDVVESPERKRPTRGAAAREAASTPTVDSSSLNTQRRSSRQRGRAGSSTEDLRAKTKAATAKAKHAAGEGNDNDDDDDGDEHDDDEHDEATTTGGDDDRTTHTRTRNTGKHAAGDAGATSGDRDNDDEEDDDDEDVEAGSAGDDAVAGELSATELARINKDRRLAGLLLMMDKFNPIIPDPVTDYYLARSGFQCDDVRVKRILGLAAQKFITDLAVNSMQHCLIRSQASNPKDRSRGGVKQGKRKVLAMEDLAMALEEHGINLKKPEYYL